MESSEGLKLIVVPLPSDASGASSPPCTSPDVSLSLFCAIPTSSRVPDLQDVQAKHRKECDEFEMI